jgi:iron complex outermembrane receptor protein
MDFTNEIISYGGVNPSTGKITTVNADGSYRAGIELDGAWQMVKQFKLSGNFSFNRYRIKDFVDTLDVYDASFNIVGQEIHKFENRTGLAFPEYLGSLVADYRHNGVRATYRLQLVGKQYMELLNLDSLAIDAHTVSSVTASYTFNNVLSAGNLTLSGTVSNLFDKKYEQSGYGWNYGYVDSPGASPVLLGGAEYYVAAQRTFFFEATMELF